MDFQEWIQHDPVQKQKSACILLSHCFFFLLQFTLDYRQLMNS